MLKVFFFFVGLFVLLGCLYFLPVSPTDAGVTYLSQATSLLDNSVVKASSVPTAVSCALNGTATKKGDGSTELTFSWTYTADANVTGQINPGLGGAWTPSSTNQTIVAVITKPQTFTLVAADGIATSTCNFTATPL